MTTPTPKVFSHHQVWVQRAFQQQPEAIGDATLQLWNSLAVELISIIGEAGFQSLFSRCMYLMRVEYPWLEPTQSPTPIGTRLLDLKARLDSKQVAIAEQASLALLNTFMRLLSGLIGEALTVNILHAAWGDKWREIDKGKSQEDSM